MCEDMKEAVVAAEENPADTPRVITGSLAAAMIGGILTNILPMYLGVLAESKHLDSQRIGYLASAFFLGFNISGLCAFAWVRRLNWRNVCLATLPVSMASFLWSAQSESYLSLAAATILAGASLGVIYTVGTVVIGDTTNSSRWYGVKMAAEAAGGMVLIFLMPIVLIPRFGLAGVVGGIGVYCILLLPALLLLPNCWAKGQANPSESRGSHRAAVSDKVAIGATIFALFSFCVGNAAIWAFAERIGKLGGYSDADVGTILVVTLASGVGGALGVAAVGDRLGSAKCFIFVAILGLIGLTCLNAKGVFPLYAVGNCLCSASWVAGSSFAMGETAHHDIDGRYVALIVPAIGLGSMLGPSVAGWLINIGTPSTAFIFSGSCILASMLAMAFVHRRSVAVVRRRLGTIV